MIAKRIFDLVLTIPGVLVLLPLFLAIAVWIKLDSRGPVFFRQVRVGQFGQEFYIYKFRTMIVDAERYGKQITVGADRRITRAGRFLRQYKLDELPQLFNVVLGDMSLVGPRPEVPRYIKEYSDVTKNIVLSVKPGITDLASLLFKDENDILGEAVDPERTYIETVLPVKQNYYIQYVSKRSLILDLSIIWKTIQTVFLHSDSELSNKTK